MKTLLPSGCYDVLPPLARLETRLSGALLGVFEAYGYAQVAPPLLEYSDDLLAGRGASLSSQMFRVMDPTANRVMGIRPDITLQIARIAADQLKDAPRPLRLCYNGLILRLQGEQLRPDRQLRQVGIELIGAASPEADAEVITIAARALAQAGIREFTIDLNLPSIAAALTARDALTDEQTASLYTALARKDATALAALPLAYKDTLVALLQTGGEAKAALKTIEKLDMPTEARTLVANLQGVVSQLEVHKEAGWSITVDATESQGYSYHSGVGFAIFVAGVAYEVGRGGRYQIEGEEATGFTLYVETLRSLLPAEEPAPKVLVGNNTGKAECEKLQAEGYVTLYGLPFGKDQAAKLGCQYVFDNGKLVKL